jgi:peptidoglycan/xylan/chitin deacetylase (PgdA/CDA1 family)
MALTFDDGPWDHYTSEVLDVLGRHGVTSTFFMVGDRVNRSPAMAKRVWEEGHEIGVHTQHHQSLSKISVSQQNLEISQNWEAIRLAVPEAPVYWWRAPYGDVPKPTPSAVNELGLHHKAWSIDTNSSSLPLWVAAEDASNACTARRAGTSGGSADSSC